MRPLPVMQRSRAALWSVAGHGVLIAGLAVVSTRTELIPFPSESPLIFAELVTARASVADAATDGGVPPRAIEAAEAPAEEPAPQAPEPLEPATVTSVPPPPAEREVEPREPPAPSRDPLPEPPAEQRVAETAPPAGPPPAETEVAPDERAAEALEPLPEPAAVAELPAGVPEPAVTPEPPSRALASNEAETVRSRLSSWTGRISADEPEPTLSWREDGREYTAVLRKVPAADAMGMEQLAVELTTERDGERLVTELRMNRLAFSNFGQFVNRWDPDVQIHDDVIDGRLHSNTALTIGRSGGTTPVFLGKVTIADGGFVTTGPGFVSRRKLFPAGIETRTRRIALPERAAALEAIAGPDNSQRFARDTALTFHADGTLSWRERGGDGAMVRSFGDEPFYLIGDDGVDLEVQGTVNGKVLVYALERIVITDDLRYAADPRTPHADDYLGLVAERSVEIAEPDVTGSGDLEVFASIYARQRFAVRNYSARRSGTLLIHGSLTAGTLTATEPRFATRIEFDNRLTTMRAPSFPLTDRYELDSLSGEWRVVGDAN